LSPVAGLFSISVPHLTMKKRAEASERIAAVAVEMLGQEIPFDAPESRSEFDPFSKQFVATRGAMEAFGPEVIHGCLLILRAKAREHGGLDYLQTFLIGVEKQKLWIIEDGEAITALLPDEY